MWVRAVSLKKDGEEEEFVCPKNWIEEGSSRVFWPRKKHKFHMDNQTCPESDWDTFTLVKVKFESGKRYSIVHIQGRV